MNKLLEKLIGKTVTIENNSLATMSLKDNPLCHATKTVFILAEDLKLKVTMIGEEFKIEGPEKEFKTNGPGSDSMVVTSARLTELITGEYQNIEIWLLDDRLWERIRISVFGSSENSLEITEVENE